MESQLVANIDSTTQYIGPWPRLLRIIALMTLIFCAAHLVKTAILVYTVLTDPPLYPGYKFTWDSFSGRRIQLSIASCMIEIVMAAGAVGLVHGRGHRLLSVSLWIWLFAAALGIVQDFFIFRRSAHVVTIGSLVVAAFPILILLILLEYSRDRAT